MSKTHVIDGKTYVEVERKANVGEKVIVAETGGSAEIVLGEIHDVDEVTEVGTVLTGKTAIIIYADEYRVLEPVDHAPQSTEDIIANLVRRVAALEQAQERLAALERGFESFRSQLRDTQNNVERQGVEIANIEAATKAPQSGAKLLADAFEALAKYERSVGR